MYISKELYLTNVFIYLVKFCSLWFVTIKLDTYLQSAVAYNELLKILLVSP